MWLTMVLATVILPGGPASAAVASSVSFAVSPSAAAPAETVVLSGVVSPLAAGRTVELQRYGTAWLKVTSVLTGSTGHYSATVKAGVAGSKATSWRAVARASATAAQAISLTRVLSVVKQSVALSAPTTGETRLGLALSGSGYPARTGRTVSLQRLSGTSWVVVGHTTESSSGRYSLTTSVTSAGKYSYRAVTAAWNGAGAVSSPLGAVSVHAPYILLAPSSAIAAETVKTTGLLPGVVSRAVWVQRKSGTTWLTLVKATTSRTGSYSTSFKAPALGSYSVRSLAPKVTVAGKVKAQYVTAAKTLHVLAQSAALSIPATLVQAKTATATAKFAPVRPGRVSALQVLKAAVWTNVGTTRTQSTTGTASFTLTAATPGSYSYRAWTAAAAGAPAYASPTKTLQVTLPPVTGVTAVPASSSIRVNWTNPTAASVTGVMIRRAPGAIAPASVTAGTLVANVAKPFATFRNTGLSPATTYSYALFAHDGKPLYAAAAKVTVTTSAPLAINTSILKDAVAGLRYQELVAGTGGVPPYTWTATGLPAGLTLSSDGALTGTPRTTGTSPLHLTLTDAALDSTDKTLSLAAPTSLPTGCVNHSCALLTPDGQTLQIPATRIGAITLGADGSATQVLLTGPAPAVGQILVLAPTADAPTGLIVVVDLVTSQSDGTSLVDVSPAGPADAYAEGTVQAIGTPVTSASLAPAAASPSPRLSALIPKTDKSKGVESLVSPRAQFAAFAPSLECDSNASSELHGLSVKPTLTPALAALWKHPLFGGGGVYVGTGGLDLFQIDIDGDITVNVGVSVSGASHCLLTLPPLRTTIPAGNLGAVIVQLEPSVDLTVSGKVDLRTSVTLHCGVEYRWDQGQESRIAYCRPIVQPLQLSSDSGVNVKAAGTMAASVSINGIAGVTGSITPAVQASYTPAAHPIAQVKATADFNLGVCLACLWKGSPAHASIVSGTIFDKVLATYDTPPAGVPSISNPVITTAFLPSGTVGEPYAAGLTTADNRNGQWAIDSGALPDGVDLVDDTLSGRPTTQGTYPFVVTFTDTGGRTASRSYSLLVGSGGGGGLGAIQNLDYCKQNVLDRNDDNSTDAVPLPFELNFFGYAYTSVYVSNNGYVRLDAATTDYTPYPLTDTTNAIIAPFFGDVDTRNLSSALVTYGSSPDGKTFCVNWIGVGYYETHMDKANSFQLLLVDRAEVAAGDFDMVFNYGSLNWETGDASYGTGGIGGTAARAGFSVGTGAPGTLFELPGSGESGALMDGGTSPLAASSQGSNGFLGRYIFPVRN
jgi:hypothetical protein